LIFSNSRYADGRIFKANDARKGNYSVTVLRSFPDISSQFFYYTWVERDRLDIIANKFIGSADAWWQIMDLNPEILNPSEIQVGTILRIPNG
jgi:hypothetical protein